MAMVVRAYRTGSGVGGHISTYASSAMLVETGFNHFFHARTADHTGDLVYFLVTNLTADLRRAHEHELIELYLQTLRRLGIGEDLLATDAVTRGYVEGAMMFAVMFVSTIGYERANARGEAFFDALVERTFTAVEDLDAGTRLGL